MKQFLKFIVALCMVGGLSYLCYQAGKARGFEAGKESVYKSMSRCMSTGRVGSLLEFLDCIVEE